MGEGEGESRLQSEGTEGSNTGIYGRRVGGST